MCVCVRMEVRYVCVWDVRGEHLACVVQDEGVRCVCVWEGQKQACVCVLSLVLTPLLDQSIPVFLC